MNLSSPDSWTKAKDNPLPPVQPDRPGGTLLRRFVDFVIMRMRCQSALGGIWVYH